MFYSHLLNCIIPKYSYFCTLINYGPIVQWIEFQIPVLKIWVRIPMGSLFHMIYSCNSTNYSYIYFLG